MKLMDQARQLLHEFKGESYVFGNGVLKESGKLVSKLGQRPMMVANDSKWYEPTINVVTKSIEDQGLSLLGNRVVPGSRPNSPREDVRRIQQSIEEFKPDCLVALGGGSTIDAVKGANVLYSLAGYSSDFETYFGVGEVTKVISETGTKLLPMLAIQTAASSGAHLTKYSNITDLATGQKKLIVDEAIVPERALFDYDVTKSMHPSLTVDGAFDGLAHCLEVFYGAGDKNFAKLKDIAIAGIDLIVQNVEKVYNNPEDEAGREALGLGTDLGGYAIMLGGTNGAHLTSFSLVDIASHGRACAIMNPYYTVFFAPAIERQLHLLADIFIDAGLMANGARAFSGRDLGIAVAEAMRELARRVGFPVTLSELQGFSDLHIQRALNAAKNPQLEMKLKNMPVPLTASMVDEYMGPVLDAAKTGDFAVIKNLNF
ncbi:MAG: iron-containing alcohol dehydrogenase [Bacillota bacterium]